ncbi:MAG: response regulator transcription factor [Erysipelotrichaceae bacterium]
MTRMLIADDTEAIVQILESYAKKEGYEVTVAHDGSQALTLALAEDFDIILLDVMMPKMDGFTVVREIRKESNVPILMITARGEDFERIMGLDIGADDYIVKPFSPGEVMARVKAILRRLDRASSDEKNHLRIANLMVDLDEYSVKVDETKINLTKKEIDLLWTLASHPGRAFSRENLLNQCWGYNYYGDSRTVDSHMTRLRTKLDSVEHPLWSLKTIWGVGYKFEISKEETV